METNLSAQEIEEMIDGTARVFKVMGDPVRIRILGMLTNGELCACKFHEALGLPQNLVSHHLKVLHENQLISARKQGRNIFYSINEKHISDIREFFGAFINKGDSK